MLQLKSQITGTECSRKVKCKGEVTEKRNAILQNINRNQSKEQTGTGLKKNLQNLRDLQNNIIQSSTQRMRIPEGEETGIKKDIMTNDNTNYKGVRQMET